MAGPPALASVVDIESFINEYFGAWHGTDQDRIMSYYADNVTVQIPGLLMQGRAALREQFVVLESHSDALLKDRADDVLTGAHLLLDNLWIKGGFRTISGIAGEATSPGTSDRGGGEGR